MMNPIIFLALYAMKSAACGLTLQGALSRKRREIDGTLLRSAFQRLRARSLCKRGCFVSLFPTEASVLARDASKMSVTRRLFVDRLEQIQMPDDPARRERKMLPHQLGDVVFRNCGRAF